MLLSKQIYVFSSQIIKTQRWLTALKVFNHIIIINMKSMLNIFIKTNNKLIDHFFIL